MREWLLIICTTQICSGNLSAVSVSEGQCREAIKFAQELVELARDDIAAGAMRESETARAFCISPDGMTRLDSRGPIEAPKTKAK
jgi:hypothetical protein